MKVQRFVVFILLIVSIWGCSRNSTEDANAINDAPGIVDDADDALFENMAETQGGEDGLSSQNLVDASRDIYLVQSGDTLMYIAFKLYGDYARWKELDRLNPGAVNHLKEGMSIKYRKERNMFDWRPQGNPHLIVAGDTLGRISTKYYQDSNQWKAIWQNNQMMIKNPNLIFAGFTLYYQPLSSLAQNL